MVLGSVVDLVGHCGFGGRAGFNSLGGSEVFGGRGGGVASSLMGGEEMKALELSCEQELITGAEFIAAVY